MNDAEDAALAYFTGLVNFARQMKELRNGIVSGAIEEPMLICAAIGNALKLHINLDLDILKGLAEIVEESRDE